MGDRRLEVADMALGVGLGKKRGDLARVADGGGASVAAEEVDGAGEVAIDRPAPGDVPDVLGQASILVADEDDRELFSRPGGRRRRPRSVGLGKP